MTQPNKRLSVIVIAILLIVVVGLIWYFNRITETVYSSDTVLPTTFIAEDERVILENDSKLMVQGDLTVNGDLWCRNGALNVMVTGNLSVNGKLRCEIENASGLGLGVNLVAQGNVEFARDSVVTTNGHVQVVDNESRLATTQTAIDELFEDTGLNNDNGTGVGPFIPIDLAPGQQALNVDSSNYYQPVLVDQAGNKLLPTLSHGLVKAASAQEPATDIQGGDVPWTIKIGGKWVVGSPGLEPPYDINIPTPPEEIKKIIIAYNFGPGKDVNISNLYLSGPDGRPGANDEGASCDAKGAKGEDAFRLNVQAANITINDFTLRMGNGGDGGSAVSQINCDPGKATGGEGGEPGNIKMRTTGSFKIVGAFKIIPGLGGFGGEAIAAGKPGENTCDGEKGGDAIATGGKGGDNKKGLKTVRVEGVNNIEITGLLAGDGGDAYAHGGDGGNGSECGCDGGPGGKATATGGEGGTATSRTVQSTGGNGGDAESYPGKGGNGGSCTELKAGGNGGKGGDAETDGGKAGSGRTADGVDGMALEEAGGNGGNGGDGCEEGKGGPGGNGEPKGQDWNDGKNICPTDTNSNTGVSVPGDNSTVSSGDEIETELVQMKLSAPSIFYKHGIGINDCPDPMGTITVELPRPGTVSLDIPAGWIAPPQLPSVPTEIISLPLDFNCNITDFSTHKESTRVTVHGQSADGTSFADSFFEIFVDIELPGDLN